MLSPTETQVVPKTENLAALTQLVAAGGPLNANKLHLYKNNITPSRNTVLADLIEADFDGYAAIAALVWSAPFLDVDGTALVMGADAAFIATGGTTPNTVFGWYLTNAGSTVLIGVFAFNTPVGIAGAGQACPVVPFFRYSGT